MTIERAKELLGDNADKYTDEEIERMVSFYSRFASLIIDSALEGGQ